MNPVISGDLEVLSALKDPTRTIGLGLSAGGVRHAYAAGMMACFRRYRLTQYVAAFAGVSSGIATGLIFMGDGKVPSVRIFANDMSGRQLFSLPRQFLGKPAFSVQYMHDVFVGNVTGRAIDFSQAVTDHRPFYAVVACYKTGESLVYEIDSLEAAQQLSVHGTAVTGFADPHEFRGELITDGFFTADNLPIDLLAKRSGVTDVLIFTGAHYETKPRINYGEQFIYRSPWVQVPKLLRHQILSRQKTYRREVERALERNNPRVLLVWMPRQFNQLRLNQATSRELIRSGYRHMQEMLQAVAVVP